MDWKQFVVEGFDCISNLLKPEEHHIFSTLHLVISRISKLHCQIILIESVAASDSGLIWEVE
jgi:hypothetical protein